jgi:hypothetical protein
MSHFFKDNIKLKGLIVPAQWDKGGRITGIAISCFDEEEYQVLMDEIGGGLMNFLHRSVQIVGEYTTRKKTKTIKVKEFSLKD